ncbi:MAG: small ribosomal subunit Rsm22 family protein, partial [Planctomycetota bacterium]
MTPTRDDLLRIERLRELFLDESRGERALKDYWRGPMDLDAYASVLAVRIGWKWDAALSECKDRGMQRADQDVVVDFGCGSGIAAERFVHHFGARAVHFYDRSATAREYACRHFATKHEGLAAEALADIHTSSPDVLLVSHVLSELDERGLEVLRALIARSRRVVIVEPGNRTSSRRLSTLRNELLADFAVLAPCPHAASCPALLRDEDWCHFFAEPKQMAFTDSAWVKLSKELSIDQRSLPYSFLALQRTPVTDGPSAPDHRILYRPEVGKHDAKVQLCTNDGVVEALVTK